MAQEPRCPCPLLATEEGETHSLVLGHRTAAAPAIGSAVPRLATRAAVASAAVCLVGGFACWVSGGGASFRGTRAAVAAGPAVIGLDEGGPSLYCWSLMRPSGNEPELMSVHQSRGVGIWRCEGHQVFSSESGTFNGVAAIGVGADPSHMCNWQNQVFYACNTQIFVKAWEMVVAMGDYSMYQWTIKVDPDAGFFPAKLKQHLSQVDSNSPRLIQNANFPKMLGPLEVVSSMAVGEFANRKHECYDKLDEEYTGEDGYFSDCFSQVLGVPDHGDWGVLENSGNAGSCSGGAAAVHAFKDRWALEACYNNAGR